MLEFKKIEIKDIEIYKKFTKNSKERSCENAFVNLLVWQSVYKNMIALTDDLLIIKSGGKFSESFRIPFGENTKKGIELIEEYIGSKKTKFWATEGARYEKFKDLFADAYEFIPERDAFDYLYLREDLANLSGKKYHSKRNHISAFSKKYEWHYEKITKQNVSKILSCAEKWYKENSHRMDKYMEAEKQGVSLMLENMQSLEICGGAIFVEDKAVAFTLGSQISADTYDIHIEKALSDYAEGYTVINREFAKNLPECYKYINREDDMGLEGLRKAKLSYKPCALIEKYRCVRK